MDSTPQYSIPPTQIKAFQRYPPPPIKVKSIFIFLCEYNFISPVLKPLVDVIRKTWNMSNVF